MVTLPRLVIAAASSGQGKTMLAIGLMGALRRRGLSVAPNKVGPDYIDPGYHLLATGRPSRNLDPILCPPSLIPRLLLAGATRPDKADIAVIEGVMGMFDGRIGHRGAGSTADIACRTRSPVILCCDASGTSRTIAATIAGLAAFDRSVHVAGVVINKVASPRHRDEIAEAMTGVGVPILGFLPRSRDIEAPSRHLGLVPAEERTDAAQRLASLVDLVDEHLDLDALLMIAHGAPPIDATPWQPTEAIAPPGSGHPVVAMAGGRAFTFRYAETAELLAAGGCKIVELDPTTDRTLPTNLAGLYLGGGFPEVHATELSDNRQLLSTIREALADGVPTVAECAGMLYLGEAIDGVPMAGALPLRASMQGRLTMGYRDACALQDSPLTTQGVCVVGHEHHRTTIQTTAPAAWSFDGLRRDGLATSTVHASYLHTHWAGQPALAQRFITHCHVRSH